MNSALAVVAKPFQKPYPELVGTVVTPNTLQCDGFRRTGGVHPLSANFLLPKWVKTHWDAYVKGTAKVGVDAHVANWRVARTIFVADD